MEKNEIFIESGKVGINFYFSDSLVSEEEIEQYKYWFSLGVRTIDTKFYKLDKPISINVSIASDEEIIEINSEHRQKKKVTDVLSFPMQDNMRNSEYDSFMPELELGDIIICKSVCVAQAEEFELTYFEEFIHLFIHGFLHVYGYDHEISLEEEKIMFDLEEELVLEISKLKKSDI